MSSIVKRFVMCKDCRRKCKGCKRICKDPRSYKCRDCRKCEYPICPLCIYHDFRDSEYFTFETFTGKSESKYHLDLKDSAAKWMQKRFKKIEISYEWGIYFVDVMGISKSASVAIEVGDCYKEKLEFLALYFDEVYHWPYDAKEPIRIRKAKGAEKYKIRARFNTPRHPRYHHIYRSGQYQRDAQLAKIVMKEVVM